MRVLIIEDDPDTAECIKRILRLPGAEIFIATDMKSAASAIELHRPNVAVFDLNLPDSKPLETVERLRQFRSTHPEMGTVVVTGAVDPAIANGSGADAVMHKLDMAGVLRREVLESVRLHLKNPNSTLQEGVELVKTAVASLLKEKRP